MEEQQRVPLRQRSLGKALLALAVFLLFALGVFGYFVFTAYQRVQRGEVDLSAYSDTNALTATGAAATGILKVSRAAVETADDPALGPADATVTIVEFADFECPFCRLAFPILKQLLEQYNGQIHVIFRDFPVASLHRHATNAAIAAACAQDQGKFWEYHDLLYLNQDQLDDSLYPVLADQLHLNASAFAACLQDPGVAAEVHADYTTGVQLGVRGTPTWFVNGRRLEGAVPLDLFQQVIALGLAGKLDD